MARSCEHSEQECKQCWKERIGSVHTAASATPSRKISRREGHAPKDKPKYNQWENGEPRDPRGMPYLNADGGVVGNKEFAETRTKYRKHQKTNIV